MPRHSAGLFFYVVRKTSRHLRSVRHENAFMFDDFRLKEMKDDVTDEDFRLMLCFWGIVAVFAFLWALMFLCAFF